jgi:pimeloyl-ACP methyl ester carboxylesterase
MQLNYRRVGQGDPLVLIHGIGSRWQVWEPVLPALAAVYDVIALDLPGFGESPMPPPGTAPGAASLADLVSGFLEELDIERPHVAGNSLGGLISVLLAQRGRVRSATVLSPAGFANDVETWWARGSLRVSVTLARLLASRADRLFTRPGLRKLAYDQVVAHPERLTPVDAAESLRALAYAPWFDETLNAIDPGDLQHGVPIDVPVTIGWGEKDRLLLPRQAKRAERAIPGARLVWLRGCGHVPTYDDPDQVARVMLEGAARG